MTEPRSWQAHEYAIAHHQLLGPEREAKFAAEVARRAAQGWRIHTIDTTGHPDVDVVWERPAQHGSALAPAQARIAELEAELSRLRQGSRP